jgi:hypothetical protein
MMILYASQNVMKTNAHTTMATVVLTQTVLMNATAINANVMMDTTKKMVNVSQTVMKINVKLEIMTVMNMHHAPIFATGTPANVMMAGMATAKNAATKTNVMVTTTVVTTPYAPINARDMSASVKMDSSQLMEVITIIYKVC